MHLVAPLDLHFPLLYVLLREHVADNPEYKVYVQLWVHYPCNCACSGSCEI